MRMILVGDVHATADSLEECKKLIDFVSDKAKEEKADYIWFSGDQFHSHAIVHLEVMKFWRDAFVRLRSEGFHVIGLVGNHDRPGSNEAVSHAMMPYEHLITVVDEPTLIEGKTLHLPYMASNDEFVAACNEYSHIPIVFCHQDFDGAQYENGFYSQNGVDSNLIPQRQVISGHIHMISEFDKVWYVGSPRWRTLSDANQDRAIWFVEIEDGQIAQRKAFSTTSVCTPIYSLVDTPDAPAEIPEGKAKVSVDIRGPVDYVTKRAAELAGKGVRVRPLPDNNVIRVKESDGIPTAFTKYAASFIPKNGTSKEALMGMAKERISWLKQ